MSEGETPTQRARRLWADPEISALLRQGALQRRLDAARKRRDDGQRPLPLDNLALVHFGEEPNPRELEKPREPHRPGACLEVLETLRGHPDGLTANELGRLLGRPENDAGGVRPALDHLRNKLYQPILLTPEGRFRLLRPGEY